MTDDNNISLPNRLARWLTLLVGSPWIERAFDHWKLVRKMVSGLAEEGMYEVLEYESTLELLDRRGEQAHVSKREKVSYLQNNTMAYQDQAWGDGKILINYRCTPGVPVDQYRPGQKTYILISLRESKNRGDTDEYYIEWDSRGGFRRDAEQWEAAISHRTRRLIMRVLFPKSRPPLRVTVLDSTRLQPVELGDTAQQQLPDGRWQITYEQGNPRLYGSYCVRWEW